MRQHPWTVHELAARMPGGPLKRLIGGDVLANVSLGRKGWGVAFLWMLLYWISDMACLAIAFFAVGALLPWQGLLIAYAAASWRRCCRSPPGARRHRGEHERCPGHRPSQPVRTPWQHRSPPGSPAASHLASPSRRARRPVE